MRDRVVLLVDNEAGVLAKIAGLFAGKDCNIESITSARAPDPALLRLTIEVSGGESKMPRLRALLAKMLPVHSVEREIPSTEWDRE